MRAHHPTTLLLLLLLAASAAAPTEYAVAFDTPNPLGLKLDASLRVLGFHREAASGERLPAEKSNWIRVGDTLASVNGVRVAGMALASVTLLVARAELPKRLTLLAPGDRELEMAGVLDGPAGIHGHEGALELASRAGGLALGAAPFLQAAFGGQLSCGAAPLVFAQPPHGCSAYTNTRALFGAIVVVERGLCTFSDKAAIAQGVAAVGLVVLNDASGAYVRMPIDEAEALRLDLTIPAVMVDAGRGADLVRSLLTGSSSGGGAGSAGAKARSGGAGGGAQPPAAPALPAEKKVLGGVQARMVRKGTACKPWKKGKGEGGGAGKGGGGGSGSGGKRGSDGKALGAPEGEPVLGDPVAQGGELLLFAPGTPLAHEAPAAQGGSGSGSDRAGLRGAGRGAGSGSASGSGSGSSSEEGAGGEGAPHRHTSGFYSDAEDAVGGSGSGSGSGSGGGGSAPRAARGLEAAAAAARARWEEEEAAEAAGGEGAGEDGSGAGGELASLRDVAALAALERVRRRAALRSEYVRGAFGGALPQGRLRLVAAQPGDACAPLQGAPGRYAGAAVLVERGTCGFVAKAAAVAAAGGAAMVAGNSEPGLFAMGGEGGSGSAVAGGEGTVAGAAPSVMVTRSTATALKAAIDAAEEGGGGDGAAAAAAGHESVAAAAAAHPELLARSATVSFLGNADAYPAWEELGGLLAPSAWGEDGSARRKAYQRLARVHHPDRSTGSQERFQLLAFLFRRANHFYDPASEPGFQNEL